MYTSSAQEARGPWIGKKNKSPRRTWNDLPPHEVLFSWLRPPRPTSPTPPGSSPARPEKMIHSPGRRRRRCARPGSRTSNRQAFEGRRRLDSLIREQWGIRLPSIVALEYHSLLLFALVPSLAAGLEVPSIHKSR